ncbi:MAG: hypothetical protein PHE93_01340 [Clostridia bacterium]|nr:hypothetical protein [Clostridia bacterium]
MLDTKLTQVLEIIQSFCNEPDAYKILDADDILTKLPSDMEMTKLQLSVAIKELKDRELVKVKYFTLDEYCLSASPRAKIEQEKREEEIKVEAAIASMNPMMTDPKTGKRKKVVAKGGFWGAFFGALFGGGIIMAVYIVVQMFVL